MKRTFFSIFFIALFAGFLFFQIPILYKRGIDDVAQTIQNSEVIELSGKTLFVSDLHLITPEARVNLNVEEISHIVIVGNFFDTQEDFERFGTNLQERIENGLGVFLEEEFTGNVYFISSFNHDPELDEFELEIKGMKFFHVGKSARFLIEGTKVIALHGDELYNGVIGGGISWLFGKFGILLPLERLGKTKLNIEKETWLITGHSHVPGLDQVSRVANTGSFVGVPFNDLIFHIPIGTGIMIKNDKVELVYFTTPPLAKPYWF